MTTFAEVYASEGLCSRQWKEAPVSTALSGRAAAWTGTGLSAVLWLVPFGSIALLPVRPYATVVHEVWHALVALLTGGQVAGIQLEAGGFGGGAALIAGGWSLAIAAAGYLGSAVTGALWLRSLGRPGLLRGVLVAHAVLLPVVAIVWSRSDFDAVLALLGLAALAAVAAKWLGRRSLQVICALLALQLCLAALGDLRTLFALTTATEVHNDAQLAASFTPIPAVVWAVVWGIIGLLAVFWGLRGALGLPSLASVRRRFGRRAAAP